MTDSTQQDKKPTEGELKRDNMSQKDYYSKWNSFEKSALNDLDEEEKREEEEENEKVGKNKYAMSEAEAKDKETHEKLKEAKRLMDLRQAKDNENKIYFSDLTSETRVFSMGDFGTCRVVILKDCTDCTFDFPESLHGLIKIFIEGCNGCTFNFRCRLITSHVEIAHCKGGRVMMTHTPLHTLQIDLCESLEVEYGQGVLAEGQNKIYHAGSSDITIRAPDGQSTHADYIRDLAPLVLVEEGSGEEGSSGKEGGALASKLTEARPEETHFITQLLEGRLVTEKAVQVGNRWVTAREMEHESVAGAAVTQRQLQDMKQEASRQKEAGNQAFGNAEYAQAAVHYTMALDHESTSRSDDELVPALVHICYSNRAACFLKLGQHEKALQDADSCVALQPDFVKGPLRRGLALHIAKRYRDALESLGRAKDLEAPAHKASLKQINEAIRFAEVKLAAQMRAAQQS